MLRPGKMYRNGHGICGGCRLQVDGLPGGRQRRKAKGWTYTGRERLGWCCSSCSRWAAAPRRDARPRRQLLEVRPVRGFDFSILPTVADLVRRRRRNRMTPSAQRRRARNQRRSQERKARRKERRAQRRENVRRGLPADDVETAEMSPSEYRTWRKAQGLGANATT